MVSGMRPFARGALGKRVASESVASKRERECACDEWSRLSGLTAE